MKKLKFKFQNVLIAIMHDQKSFDQSLQDIQDFQNALSAALIEPCLIEMFINVEQKLSIATLIQSCSIKVMRSLWNYNSHSIDPVAACFIF